MTKTVPEGENIKYSTLCRISQFYSKGKRVGRIEYNSHVLFTDNYIVFEERKSFGRSKPMFFGYNTISKVKKDEFRVIGPAYKFKLKRAREYESEEDFQKRASQFPKTILPILITSLEQKLENNPDLKKRKVKKINKKINEFKSTLDKQP